MSLTLEGFLQVRCFTLALAAPLSAEDAAAQSMPDASPAKWHLAHTSWFFEAFLLGPRGWPPYDPSFHYLFNSYYEALGPRLGRASRGLLTRPSLAEVRSYRQAVDEAMANAWETLPGELIQLGIQHEQQHQELILTDIQHLLYANPLRPAYRPGPPRTWGAARTVAWRRYEGGLVSLGHGGPGFHFDNEGPAHPVFLSPFQLADRCVTQGEYLAFILDGGYRQPAWWLSDGWSLLQREGWQAPLYWEGEGTSWRVFTLAGLGPLEPDAPVAHVSFFEAAAFASWSQARLPTEGEWELAATGDPLQDLFGQVWQWTASPYVPYPGFHPARGALGEYNGKFMVNQLVLRGGSQFTPPGHSRPTYRNFFPPQTRWQVSGIRLARDIES